MKNKTAPPSSIDEYIRSFPKSVREKLMEIRRIVGKTTPGATERISYRMPAFFLDGNLVYFAGYAGHIGFYPGAAAIDAFSDELAGYKWAKGSVKFPIDAPLPVKLITRMVKFKKEEARRSSRKKKPPRSRSSP